MRGVRLSLSLPLSLSLASQLNGKRERKKEKNDCTADRSSAFAATELWYVVFDTVFVSVVCFPEFLTLLSVFLFLVVSFFRVLDAVVGFFFVCFCDFVLFLFVVCVLLLLLLLLLLSSSFLLYYAFP